MTGSDPPGIAFYDRKAQDLARAYDAIDFEALHGLLLPFLPSQGPVLDVGAGSGRDARALAFRGLEVVAVEPSEGMRREAARHPSSPKILWKDDSLPDLESLPDKASFSLILVSAVWMHVPPEHRDRAFRRLSGLLLPEGHLFLTFRRGPDDCERGMAPVNLPDTLRIARECGLSLLVSNTSEDLLGRSGITWSALLFRRAQRT
ncbi:MAG: class I SAM-dependent methyltransferase [Leptospirillia bacterium]